MIIGGRGIRSDTMLATCQGDEEDDLGKIIRATDRF